MRKITFVIVFLFFVISVGAQKKIRNLQLWSDKQLIDYPYDQDSLYSYIDNLNLYSILPLKQAFDNCRGKDVTSNYRTILRAEIERVEDKIEKNVDSIEGSHFYYDYSSGLSNKKDSSFLFYYTNKELNDYMNTLRAFKQELPSLMNPIPDNSMSVFNKTNFLNAYYNVNLSRSLLLAAMNNLERYYLLGTATDSIISSSDKILKDLTEVYEKATNIDSNLTITDSVVKHTDTLLSNSFLPYKMGQKSINRLKTKSSSDKISMASNAVLMDSRRNWWWRTLISGVVGGLVAGFFVKLF